MIDYVDGFKNQVWRIIKYEGITEISERRIPLSETSEAGIIAFLHNLASETLTVGEVRNSPHLFEVTKDDDGGNRLSYRAGENPLFVASLWRSDELEDKDG